MASRENNQFHPTLEVLEDRTLPSTFHVFKPLNVRPVPAQFRNQRGSAAVFRSQNVTFTAGGISTSGFSSTVHPNFQTRAVGINGPVIQQTPGSAAQPDGNTAGFDSFFIAFGTGRPSPIH